MKANLLSVPGIALCAGLLAVDAQIPANASLAQYPNLVYANNFSSLTDAGWTHISAFALSTGQTWSAATGGYRLTAPPNGYNPGSGPYGWVGSAVTGLPMTDGYVQSDVVSFSGPGGFGAIGVGSRLGSLSTALGLTGYAIVYEPFGASGAGDIRLERIGPPSIFNSLGALNVTLFATNKYTFTLETTGSTITGSLWDVGQVGTSLVGSITATDATYASGSVGVFGVTQAPLPNIDVTFDNVLVYVPEPGTASLLALGLVGFVVRRRISTKRS